MKPWIDCMIETAAAVLLAWVLMRGLRRYLDRPNGGSSE